MHGRTAPTFPGVLQKMRYGFLIGLVLLLGLAAGCSDDDDGAPAAAVAAFTGSATAAAPNGVRLEGTSVSNDVINVQVVLDGATTSADLYAFAFDILLSNPGVVNFIAGSALFGDALETTLPQGELVLVSQQGDRVIVAVSKTTQGVGNGFGAVERLILSLSFTVGSGSTTLTFVGSPLNPMNPTTEPTALDSALNPIGTITFDALSATISR